MKKIFTILFLFLGLSFSIAQPYPPVQITPASIDARGLKVRNTPNIPNPDSIFVMMDRDATGRWLGRMSINQLVRTNQFYNNPNWLLSLSWNKVEGIPTFFPTNRSNVLGLNSALDSIVTVLNTKQPIGTYITAESDPNVPLYAKSLTGFSAIKNSTDALYQPIGNYLTSFTELDPTVPAFAKGLTGVTALRSVTDPLYYPSTNPNGYINLSQVPAALVSSVNSKTGAVVINASDVGLGNVNNTSDANKPLSTATTNALAGKQNTVTYYNASGTIPQSTKVWKARVPVTSSAMTIDLSSAGFTSVTNLIAHVDIERLGITPANAITRKIRSLTATTLIVDLYQPLAIVLGGLGMGPLTDFTSTWLHITVEGN